LFSNAPECRSVEETSLLTTTDTIGRLIRWIGYVE